jgi:2-oxoacid:acceptor oxidoreductase gamma subunit (pyruvate/2-ketoisovalerate family)
MEIQIAGRGGQGAVLASQILAEALFAKGMWIQAFPSFGAERRGAPVAAFLRVSDREIRQRCALQEPDWLVAFDAGLVAGAAATAKTCLVVNRGSGGEQPRGSWGRVYSVDATAIAQGLGLRTSSFPLVNTAMLGAFAKASGQIDLESLLGAIRKLASQKVEANEAAAREAYERVQEATS